MATPDLDGLKQFLNKTDNTDDTELETYLGASIKAVSDRCGPLSSTAFTERVRANCGSFVVTQWPIINISAITEPDGTAVDITAIDLDNNAGIVHLNYIHGPHDVTYTAGYAPCPDDLELATYIIGKHLWETQRGTTGGRGQYMGGGDPLPTGNDAATIVVRGFAFPQRAMELMDANRKPGLA